MHCILLPKSNIPVSIFEYVDAVAVFDIAVALPGVTIEVEESIFLLHLQI